MYRDVMMVPPQRNSGFGLPTSYAINAIHGNSTTLVFMPLTILVYVLLPQIRSFSRVRFGWLDTSGGSGMTGSVIVVVVGGDVNVVCYDKFG
jgi:hypothetical protein